MEHPTYEQLLSHFEGSGTAAEDKAVQEHLQQCPKCAAELAGWRRTVQRLQNAGLLEPEKLPVLPTVLMKWAAAAAVFILASGFALGRFFSPSVSQLRKTIALEVRQQVQEEFKQEFITPLQTSDPGPNTKIGPAFRQALASFLSNQPGLSTNGLQAALQASERRQAENQQVLLSLLSRLRQDHESDYLSLRRDLETVASVADRNLRYDQQQLTQLTATMFAKER